MNAALSAVKEDSEADDYEDPTPVMMAGTFKEKEEDGAFILTPQLVGYIEAALKAAGWKLEE